MRYKSTATNKEINLKSLSTSVPITTSLCMITACALPLQTRTLYIFSSSPPWSYFALNDPCMYAISGSMEPAERILSYLPPAARKEIEMKSLQNKKKKKKKKKTQAKRFASEKDISNITASRRRRRRRRRQYYQWYREWTWDPPP